jgi:hypothetical protein
VSDGKAPAPFDPSKPCTTRDGRSVRILCTDAKSLTPIIALVRDGKHGYEMVCWYNRDGRSLVRESPNDLVNVRPRIKREVWLNV